MGQLDAEFLEERRFSDPDKWPTFIPYILASDGSEGGYTSDGYVVAPSVMTELVSLRYALSTILEQCKDNGIEIDVI